MKVLLVDDDAMLRSMLKIGLQGHGFQVLDASSGAEALTLAQAQPIDVLVADVVMGYMDGWTLAASLLKQYPDLPVLFISGYTVDFESKRQSYPRSAFLQKPFLIGKLVDAIADLSGALKKQKAG